MSSAPVGDINLKEKTFNKGADNQTNRFIKSCTIQFSCELDPFDLSGERVLLALLAGKLQAHRATRRNQTLAFNAINGFMCKD